MEIELNQGGFGARIVDIDLRRALSEADQARIEQALGHHGVVCFPGQHLDAARLKAFSERFGTLEINVAGTYQEPGIPEVMILSNIVEDGKPLGLADAGQDWHTDMSYSKTIAFCNVLFGIEIPVRDGEPRGCTEFCNMHAAWDDLPDELKTRLDGMTVTHDFHKFWEAMRAKGSSRAPLTAAQRAAKPPVSHPLFLLHPITGKKVLYANPGYAVRINELSEDESAYMLTWLFEHQTQARYRYRHRWAVGDVLVWDNMGTIHNAVADYRPDERRLIKRCQVMADRFFQDAHV